MSIWVSIRRLALPPRASLAGAQPTSFDSSQGRGFDSRRLDNYNYLIINILRNGAGLCPASALVRSSDTAGHWETLFPLTRSRC